jgi:hypothetical protein
MAEKLNEMNARLAELSEKRGKLDAAIEEMIGAMAEVASSARPATGRPMGRRPGNTWS